jgi:hypothetical protein
LCLKIKVRGIKPKALKKEEKKSPFFNIDGLYRRY